uniref:Proline rich 25 n=1 Tax=Rhinopithecus roxellana TaxID=61622 RepID=A0A2K6PJA7_RHIRO
MDTAPPHRVSCLPACSTGWGWVSLSVGQPPSSRELGAQRDTRTAQTDQKPPCRGGCWGQPGHPKTGGAPACPTSHPVGHRPRMCILPCGDQTTGCQALSWEMGLGPWAAGTHFLAISTTTWGRKMLAWISELLNSSGTAQSLANAVCEAQTIPGPGLRPQGTPATRAPSHKATPSTPNPWGPEQPQNRYMHPKKGVSGGPSPPPPAASRSGQTPGHEPRVQAPGLGSCGRPASARLPSLHLEKGDGKGTRTLTPLTAAAAGGDRSDVPSAIAAGPGRTPDGHSLPLQCPKLPGSTLAPMVGRGRVGAPMGQGGGGISAWSSWPSCVNVLLPADASLAPSCLYCGLGSSRGEQFCPQGRLASKWRCLCSSLVLPQASGWWSPGRLSRPLQPTGQSHRGRRPALSPQCPRAGDTPACPGQILGATRFRLRSCPLGSPAVLAITTGWSHRSV